MRASVYNIAQSGTHRVQTCARANELGTGVQMPEMCVAASPGDFDGVVHPRLEPLIKFHGHLKQSQSGTPRSGSGMQTPAM